MRTTLILAGLILSGCAGTKPSQKPIGTPSPTPIVREHQSKLSREREAASQETAGLPVEGQYVR